MPSTRCLIRPASATFTCRRSPVANREGLRQLVDRGLPSAGAPRYASGQIRQRSQGDVDRVRRLHALLITYKLYNANII